MYCVMSIIQTSFKELYDIERSGLAVRPPTPMLLPQSTRPVTLKA